MVCSRSVLFETITKIKLKARNETTVGMKTRIAVMTEERRLRWYGFMRSVSK